MLITNQARLLELVTALRDHVSFFLENINTRSKRGGTGHATHSNFIKEISNFLHDQYSAGIKLYIFENKAFTGLIKQPHILKLTSTLQASINLFLEALESGPKKIDESVLSKFLQQIFNFIGKNLNPSSTPSTPLIPSTITARDFHSHRQSPPAINDPPQSTISTCALSAVNPEPIENSHSCKAKSPSTFNRSTIASQQNSLLKQRDKPEYRRCALLFSNPSPDATLLDISEWCCGGPLVGISRQDTNKFRVGWSYPTNFLIQFVRTDDAAAFLTFAKSLKRDSSLLAGQTADISIDWNPYQQNAPLPTTVDALNNPARRVLIFEGYPVETVTKDELVEMFRALSGGSAFKAHTILSFEIFAENREAHLLFNKVEVATGIMELYNLGRLGDRFKNCRVLFGRDPSDRPIPER